MMETNEAILILDGHTNQALACVRSLGHAGYQVFVASHQRFPLAAWSRYCQGTFRLAKQSVESFGTMREWAKRRNIKIVLPLTERSCLICNEERPAWDSFGMTIGCGPNEMLFAAFDKAKTILRARACDVSTPPTVFPGSLGECFEAVDQVGLPLIIKARRSNAWNSATFAPTVPPAYINHQDDIANAVFDRKQGVEWPLIQGFVPGTGKGVFALCDHGRVVAWFAHERLRDTRPTGSSSSLRRSIPLSPRLREPAEKLLSALNWHGPAMVEFKDDGINPPCLMEVNGRFWGSLQLAIDAGVDFPRLWVSLLKGNKVEAAPGYSEGLALRWFWGDVKRFVWIMRGAPRGFPGAYPTIRQGVYELLGPQPLGTRLETWRTNDPFPAAGELASGLVKFFEWFKPGLQRDLTRSRNQTAPSIGPVITENRYE
jgi:predicted ATP-grasp superfamily ATP-dependent carboligase